MIKLLVVDNDHDVVSQIKYFFIEEGYSIFTSGTAQLAINMIRTNKPEVVIIDYDLPDMNGIELVKIAKEMDETIKFVMISEKLPDQEMKEEAKELGIVECINKPFKMRYLKDHTFRLIQAQQFKKEKSMLHTIRDLELKSLQVAINALESKDPYTDGHSKRVKEYAVGIAKELNKKPKGWKKVTYKHLEWAALLHDLGKIGIQESILNKPGRLTENEFEEIKKHPLKSAKILSPLKQYFNNCIEAIIHHHERVDGSGYPHGLKDKEIPLIAKILSVADSFDAMTSGRIYKKKISTGDAVKELVRCKNSQFDPMIVDSFVTYLSEGMALQTYRLLPAC